MNTPSEYKGFHHFFIGVALGIIGLCSMLIGFTILMGMSPDIFWADFFLCAGTVEVILALWVAIDDYLQHRRQRKNPEYRSLLNRWYVSTVGRIPWVAKLNEWADRQF
jgi:hypothetical protein